MSASGCCNISEREIDHTITFKVGVAGAAQASFSSYGKSDHFGSVPQSGGTSRKKCTCSQDKYELNQAPLSEDDHRDQALFIRGYRVCNRNGLKLWPKHWFDKRRQDNDGFHYYSPKKPEHEMDVGDSGDNDQLTRDGLGPHDDTPKEGGSGFDISNLGGNISDNGSTYGFMTATSSPGGPQTP
ncbi:hypothetical protein M422DRAFT_249052 [Sphaerobolus stellatus SS14]|nr:hypothetical protein M422DRAFT_249052 [Sphaerobolus stellatus SS14]